MKQAQSLTETEQRLRERIRAGGPDALGARNALVLGVQRLIRWRLTRMLGHSPHAEEAYPEALAAVFEHVQRWDPDDPQPFASSVLSPMRRAIGRYLSRQARPVPRPSGRWKELREVDAATHELRGRLQREPRRHEIAEELHWTRRRLERTIGSALAPFELDRPYPNSDQRPDLATDGPTPEQKALDAELTEQATAALSKLPERRCQAVTGLHCSGECPSAVAEAMGVSRQRVYQLATLGLAELRRTVPPTRRP